MERKLRTVKAWKASRSFDGRHSPPRQPGPRYGWVEDKMADETGPLLPTLLSSTDSLRSTSPSEALIHSSALICLRLDSVAVTLYSVSAFISSLLLFCSSSSSSVFPAEWWRRRRGDDPG